MATSARYPPDEFLSRYDGGAHIIEKELFKRILFDILGTKGGMSPDEFDIYVDGEFFYADLDKDGVLSRDDFEIYYWAKLRYMMDMDVNDDSPDLYVYFVAYASRGSLKPKEKISLPAFVRMCRVCGLLQPPRINEAVCDLVFYDAWQKNMDFKGAPPGTFPGGNRATLQLDYFLFLWALKLLAGKLDVYLRHVIHAILTSQAPSVAWAPGDILPGYKISLDPVGGGGDVKKGRRKLNNGEEEDAGAAKGPKLKGQDGTDPVYAKRMEFELNRLQEDLRQMERELENERFLRMDEQRTSRHQLELLKQQLAAERARREELETLKNAQIESLRKELAEALNRNELLERQRREDIRKLKQEICDLTDKYDKADEARREEIRALRAELDNERNLRAEEVALYREELKRVRAELEAERARYEAEMQERIEVYVRLRAELDSANRYRDDLMRDHIEEVQTLRAKFEVERKNYEAMLRQKEELILALRGEKDREAGSREAAEAKRKEELSKLKALLEQERSRREAAEQRANSMEDRMKREIDAERNLRDSEGRAYRKKIEVLEADLAQEQRLKIAMESKQKDIIYALQKEVEREKARRETESRALSEEISRLKLLLEQEKAARLQAETATQAMQSKLRQVELEKARIQSELDLLQHEATTKHQRIRDLEALLQKLISEYQTLVNNDINLAKVMASLRDGLKDHSEKLEKRSASQLDSLLVLVNNANNAPVVRVVPDDV